jgi:hypothetical protein
MSPNVVLQPIGIATWSRDSDGRLLRLEDDMYAEAVRGHWFLETAFGRLAERAHVTFTTLDEAAAWTQKCWFG